MSEPAVDQGVNGDVNGDADDDADDEAEEFAEEVDEGPKLVQCSLCRTGVPQDSTHWVNNVRLVCSPCADRLRAELAARVPNGAAIARAAGGGLVGALAGAIVWSAIAIGTGFEVGFIATLVGFLAGYGVKKAAGRRSGELLQYIAAAMAVIGLLVAKYVLYAYLVVKMGDQHGVDISYLNLKMLSLFPRALGDLLGPLDLVFAFLALAAAYRVARPPVIVITKAL